MAEELEPQLFPHISTKRHSRRDWIQKLQECGCKCYYCEEPLTMETATKDHRTPTCREGSDGIENIVPACLRCNQMKSWRTEAEFLRAYPQLAQKWEAIGRIPKPNYVLALEDRIAEPGLLKRIISKRDGMRTSWAWRNPPPEREAA